MERVSILEIAAILTAKSKLKKKDADRFANTIFEVVKDGLATDRLVKIKGLGTFKVIDIESRESVNVNTGERVVIEGHEKVTFTPDTTMKELVNKPFSQFETVVLNEGVEFDDPVEPEEPVEAGEAVEAVEAVETVEPVEPVEAVEPVQEDAPILQFVEPIEEQEPQVEETPVEEPAVEEEPVVEEEPAVEEPEPKAEEPEPEAEVTPEPPVEETPEPESEEEFDESILEEMELNRKYRNKLRNWAIVALFACAGSFVAGYFVGHHQSEAIEATNMDEVAVGVQEETDSSAVVQKDAATEAVAPDTMPSKSQSAENVAPVPVPVTTPTTPAAAAPAGDYSKYEQMDGRVRTGAYRIVGTAEEVKAKEGETVGRISRRYLGPDMECYVEVYNGLKASTQLKAGQTIKIPKLEVKKLKKKSSKN